mmetsp:Transcript_18035/g.27265  ORF Transcript_18035/g.27265 Transcript_18035/m.27265 type:complete len:343 (-) Transcript_18035:185-1213(-)
MIRLYTLTSPYILAMVAGGTIINMVKSRFTSVKSGASNSVTSSSNAKKTAPFELDATDWDIDTKEFAATWAQSQSLLGLNVDATEQQRYDQIKNWNLNCQARSGGGFKDLSFSLIDKVASEEIAAKMRVWQQKPEASSRKCTIAYVRDPLARFISAYVEFEWRFTQAENEYKDDILDTPVYKFHNYELGSKERAAAFVRDLVAFNVLDWLHELPPNLSWFDERMHKNHLLHRNAIAHVCPLVGRLRDQNFDFVGQLEHMSSDWELMADHCEIKHLDGFDSGLTIEPHVTSSDPQGTKKAIKSAFKDDCKLKTAICQLLSADYEILSDNFNYTCVGCNNEIVW